MSGQADWTHNFVANVESAYMLMTRRTTTATTDAGLPVGLFFDITKYPYSIVGFRKGLSLAIDRQGFQARRIRLCAADRRARYRADVSELDRQVPRRRRRRSRRTTLPGQGHADGRRLHVQGHKLYDPKGDAVSFQVHVIGGWSDWVASLNIITQNLRDIGIDANVKLEPDWGAWYPGA